MSVQELVTDNLPLPAVVPKIFWAFRLVDPTADDTDAQAWHGLRLKPTAGGAIVRHGLG